MEKQPIYVRGAYLLLFLILCVVILYVGQTLWIMLIGAVVLSFLMLPLARLLEKWSWPRWLASITSVFVIIAVVGSLFYFITMQMIGLMNDGPSLEQRVSEKSTQLMHYVEQKFDVSMAAQNQWIQDRKRDMINSGPGSLMSIFRAGGSALAGLVLVPIMMFFMLLYRSKFNMFLQVICKDRYLRVKEITDKISRVSQGYLRGLAIDIMILTTLNTIGFLIFGLPYALLFGLIAAVLNIIPYVGVLIGSTLAVSMALITADSPYTALGVFGVCVGVQFIDNNFLTPKVIGSSVNINPLASLIALFLGGMLWGLAGMLLSIPLAGMLKVVCDNVEALRPYGFLLGEEKVYQHRPIYERLVLPDFVKRALNSKT